MSRETRQEQNKDQGARNKVQDLMALNTQHLTLIATPYTQPPIPLALRPTVYAFCFASWMANLIASTID